MIRRQRPFHWPLGVGPEGDSARNESVRLGRGVVYERS